MALPRVVVFGEALTDIVQGLPGHWRSFPGGAPWNVARGLSRLGISCGFAGAVSLEALGDELYAESRTAGLHLGFLQRVDADPLVAVVPTGHPPRYFFAGEADLHFDPALLPQGWLDAAEICHFSCISLAREPLASTLVGLARQAKRAGKRISFDPNWRNLMGAHYRENIFPAMVALADDIKLSDEDLRHLYPALSVPDALEQLRMLNADMRILFTQGENGLLLITQEGRYEQPVIPITVADTVGAGDACMAGWLASGLTETCDYPQRLRFAAACASVSCTHSGAYAATLAEVDGLLAAERGVHHV